MCISILLCAWVLSWFGVDAVLLEGANEVLGTEWSSSSYYFLAFMGGLVCDICIGLKWLFNKKKT